MLLKILGLVTKNMTGKISQGLHKNIQFVVPTQLENVPTSLLSYQVSRLVALIAA